MSETWRLLPSNPNYEVSDAGRVRRATDARNCKRGHILVPARRPNGYLFVCICLHGVVRRRSIHVVVAEAFLGPRPDGAVVNHRNADRADNRAENLEYVSQSENVRHAYRLGLRDCRGEGNGQSRLTADTVRRIRADYDGKRGSLTRLARAVGVSQSTVRDIITRQTWTHVDAPSDVAGAA